MCLLRLWSLALRPVRDCATLLARWASRASFLRLRVSHSRQVQVLSLVVVETSTMAFDRLYKISVSIRRRRYLRYTRSAALVMSVSVRLS